MSEHAKANIPWLPPAPAAFQPRIASPQAISYWPSRVESWRNSRLCSAANGQKSHMSQTQRRKDLQLDRNELLNLVNLVIRRGGCVQSRNHYVGRIWCRLPSWCLGIDRLQCRGHVRENVDKGARQEVTDASRRVRVSCSKIRSWLCRCHSRY